MSEWVSVVGWEKFQHYKDRAPKWIKNYIDLLRRDEYTDLTPAARAVLHGLWLLTASRPTANRVRARSLSSELRMRVTREHLESLNHAGFIELSASESVSTIHKTASPETEVERERDTEARGLGGFGLAGEVVDITEAPRPKKNPDNRFRSGDNTATYTGCKWVTGQGSGTHIYDPLGIDFPPADWPHPRPSRQEVSEARARLRAA